MLGNKWIVRLLAASALATAGASSAWAINPNPTGASYSFNGTEFCQVSGPPSGWGKITASSGTAAFGATTVQVNITAGVGPIFAATPMTETTPSATYNWSMSGNSLTIGAITYQVEYNDTNFNNGQPGTIWGVALDSHNCAHTFIAQILPTS